MGDVVEFRDSESRSPGRQHREEQRIREQRERDIQRLRDCLSAGGSKGPVFVRLNDRAIAAGAVDRLIGTAKAAGISIESIKNVLRDKGERTRKGKKPGTDRIDRYRLPEKIDQLDKERRIRKLPQRVFGYMDIVDAIVEAAKAVPEASLRSQDDLKIEILKGTSFWSGPPERHIDTDPRASSLAFLLSEMTASIIRRTKLSEIFNRARRIPGAWDPISESFRPSSMLCLFQQSYLDWLEHWTEAAPLPSVPIIRLVHAEFIIPVRVERKFRESPYCDQNAHSTAFDGDERSGSFRLSREIRLAVGPTVNADTVGPMFESRAYVEIWLDKNMHTTFQVRPNTTLKPIDDITHAVPASVFQVKLDDGWHRVLPLVAFDECEALVLGHAEDPIMWPLNPLEQKSAKGQSVEHWYFSWTAVNDETVSFWLDRKIDNATSVCVPTGGSRPEPAEFWYPHSNAAHEIERQIHTGAIEVAMRDSVERLRCALDRRDSQWRNGATSATAQLVAAWQEDATEPAKMPE